MYEVRLLHLLVPGISGGASGVVGSPGKGHDDPGTG